MIVVAVVLNACNTAEVPEEKHLEYELFIQCNDSIKVHEKSDISLTQRINGVAQPKIIGRIERRGGFSISYPKYSYEIDLYEDVSLAGLPKDDDWILNANYIDKTFIRHKLSYDLFREMREENKAPYSNYITCFFDTTYYGFFLLTEKLDRSSLDVSKSDTSAFIFKEPHVFRETYDGVIPQKANNFHQQTFPKKSSRDKAWVLKELRAIILESDERTFENEIQNRLDVDNVVDWHLLLLITNNGDGILKNFYIYKPDANSKMRFAPWDYDHSFGRDGDNELNMNQRQAVYDRSILLKRLSESSWYTELLKARWNELNQKGIMSVAGLQGRIQALSSEVKLRAERNFEKWPVDGGFYYDNNSFDQEIEIMNAFVEARHKHVLTYIQGL